MSGKRGLGQNGGHFYSNMTQPAKVDITFTVAATNGLGITSLKSNGYVRNVFMHTSTTPAANNGYTNPNPANGYVLIQLKNNYNNFLGMLAMLQGPLSGSSLTSVTAGGAYIIDALGTTTLAQWQAVGLPVGVTPAVGVSFIATASASQGGTGTVKVQGASGVQSVEVVGNPVLSMPYPINQDGGGWVMAKMVGPTSSSDTTPIAVAPAAGSIVRMSIYIDLSSVVIGG